VEITSRTLVTLNKTWSNLAVSLVDPSSPTGTGTGTLSGTPTNTNEQEADAMGAAGTQFLAVFFLERTRIPCIAEDDNDLDRSVGLDQSRLHLAHDLGKRLRLFAGPTSRHGQQHGTGAVGEMPGQHHDVVGPEQ
jgi:hypothetical protein